MAKATMPVTIDGVAFDALMSEEQTLEATVPEYPVEKGYVISDAVLLGQERLSMVLMLSPAPLTWEGHGTGSGHINSAIADLRDKYYAKEPVTITTTDGTFTDMAIESITISKSPDLGYGREVPISFRKVRTTEQTVTYIPSSYGKSGGSGASAGAAGTAAGDTSSSGSDGSTLYNGYQYLTNTAVFKPSTADLSTQPINELTAADTKRRLGTGATR